MFSQSSFSIKSAALLLPLLALTASAAPTPVQVGVSVPPTCPVPPSIKSLDLEKYQGTWYEIGTTNFVRNTIERGCDCVTAEYSLNYDNETETVTPSLWSRTNDKKHSAKKYHDSATAEVKSINVLNTCYNTTEQAYSIANGTAVPVGGKEKPGELQVNFPQSRQETGANYVVTKIWGDYEQVLVGGQCYRYMWILARENVVPEERLEEIKQFATDLGFDLTALEFQLTNQTDCPARNETIPVIEAPGNQGEEEEAAPATTVLSRFT
ncbi:Calycin-like protein [Phlyctochytrium arcticum]|nr:Calycin-like protein [Phlyctochytrium arcticum]